MGEQRPGTIKELGYEVRCGLCIFVTACSTYQEASIRLTKHLDTLHAGWDAERRAALDRCPECGKERPKVEAPGPPPVPGQWYCLTHRHLKPRTQFA